MAVRLDDANDPRMLIVVPRSAEARREADALGLSGGTLVEETQTSSSFLLPFDERKMHAANGSDTGIMAMATGIVRVAGQAGRAAQEQAPRQPVAVLFKTLESLTDEERTTLSKRIKKHEQREDTMRRMEEEIRQRVAMFADPFEMADDVEIAKRTVQVVGTEFAGQFYAPVYCNGMFWRYDTLFGIWQKIGMSDMARIVSDIWWRHPRMTIRGGQMPLQLSSNKVQSVLRMLTYQTESPAFFTSVDVAGIGMRNGFLTVLDGRIRLIESAPQWRCNSFIDADFDENADCPLWKKYIDDVMMPVYDHPPTEDEVEAAEIDAKKKKDLLQEFVGACVMGIAWRFQKCLVLYGTGGNGKSVFTNVVSRLFDENSVCSVPPHDWTDKFRPQIMVGARVNLVSELPERDIADGERFKAVTVGDPITVERKYGDPVTAPITAGHIFSCNALPHANDTSDGFWRRFLLVTFARRFHGTASQDVELDRRIIENEIPGIARWALEGAIRLQRHNQYSEPDESRARLVEWRDASDPMKSFILAATVMDSPVPVTTPAGDMYRVYAFWCRENGHMPLSSTKFGAKIKQHLKTRRTKAGIVYETAIVQAYRHALRQPE